jgi:hypothetical protein
VVYEACPPLPVVYEVQWPLGLAEAGRPHRLGLLVGDYTIDYWNVGDYACRRLHYGSATVLSATILHYGLFYGLRHFGDDRGGLRPSGREGDFISR